MIVGRFYSPVSQVQDRLFQGLFNPIFSLLNSFHKNTIEIFDRYLFLINTKKENEELKRLNLELVQKNLKLEAEQKAFAHFQEIKTVWGKSFTALKPAQVIAFDPIDSSQGILLNQGAEEGIEVGQAVLSKEGVVGVVSKIFPHSSRVLLIISIHSSVDAEIIPSGARGILHGQKVSMDLNRTYWITRIEYLGNPEKISEGDWVLSSGLDKVFPKGLILGKIKNLKRDDKGLFVSAEVLPEVDFSKLSEVMVGSL